MAFFSIEYIGRLNLDIIRVRQERVDITMFELNQENHIRGTIGEDAVKQIHCFICLRSV